MDGGNILESGLEKIGLPSDRIPGICVKMEKYISEICLFNSAYNLTNTSDHDELAVRHILDSLAAVPEILALAERTGIPPEKIRIGDIGSGGGLPGIPLAAAFPEFSFTLVERMSKRCAFLENCAAILGLKNVSVMNSEAERVPPGSFDICVFRAFRPLDKKMTGTLLALLADGGFLAAYKARMDSIGAEMGGISDIVPEYEVRMLLVPGLEDSERNLVVIQKNNNIER